MKKNKQIDNNVFNRKNMNFPNYDHLEESESALDYIKNKILKMKQNKKNDYMNSTNPINGNMGRVSSVSKEKYAEIKKNPVNIIYLKKELKNNNKYKIINKVVTIMRIIIKKKRLTLI